MKTNTFFLLIALIGVSQVLQAQQKSVGLVLSGGGAKGLAHVGVLKYLEEHDIPIDFIAGASMGAIVGGFYAAGYRADEIEKIVLSDDFQEWSSGILLEKNQFVNAANDPEPDLVSFYLDLDSNFQALVNSNFVNDAPLNFALASHLYRPSHTADYQFDQLLIPFRCTASEIFTQQSLDLKDGQLSEAVRASMTVPLFFRPVKIDGRYLYDGGIYNNFPVLAMREAFDPDQIIAVNVSSKVFEEYPYGQDDELISNALKYFLLDNTDPSLLREGDVFIEPDLGNISAIDFDQAATLVAVGYKAAQSAQDTLQRLTEGRTVVPRKSQYDTLTRFDERNITQITTTGLTKRQQHYVESIFERSKRKVSVNEIRDSYYRLISDEFFRDVYPTFEHDKGEDYTLNMKVNPRNKLRFSLGGNLASRSISSLYFGWNYKFLGKALYELKGNVYAGRFYNSGKGNFRIHYPSTLPFYLDFGFNYNRWEFINAEELILNNNEKAFITRSDRMGFGGIGFTINRKGNLVLRGGYINNDDAYFNIDNFRIDDNLDETELHGFLGTVQYRASHLNRKKFPTKGHHIDLSLKYVHANELHNPGSTSDFAVATTFERNWFQFKARLEKYVGNRVSWGYVVEGVASNQPAFRNYRSTLIAAPAFFPLLDSRTVFLENFRGMDYVAAGLINSIPIAKKLEARFEGYGFWSPKKVGEGEDQQVAFQLGGNDIHTAASANLIYQSVVGPVSMSFNYYDDPDYRFGFLLNVGFLLFNPRPFD